METSKMSSHAPSPYTMKDLVKLKEQVAWLISQVKCFMGMFPSATAWTNQHSATTGNKYLKDTLVWHNGFIYKCLVDNNGNPTNNSFYWQNMGKGWLIQQEQADWNATSGPALIKNKPPGMGGPELDPIFQAWLAGNPLGSYYLASNPAGYISSYTETDPVFSAWQLANDNHANWDTAYGWGNHALAGYLTVITGPQVITALSFTPYNATNPAGYTTNVGTVTLVAALTIGTTGTDVGSSVANSTTTPVITLNIPTASATNRGALSNTDWSIFNSKQGNLWNLYSSRAEIMLFDDLIGSNAGSIPTASNGVIGIANGSGASSRTYTGAPPFRTNQQGVWLSSVGTTTLGQAGMSFGTVTLGGGIQLYETYINIETLSTATDRFLTFMGLMAGSNYINPANAVILMYDEGGIFKFGFSASANWRCITLSAGTRTETITSIPVTTTQWYKLTIEINSAGTEVKFYVDGVLVGTHTTNIPTGQFTPMVMCNKQAGTNNRNYYTDYFGFKQN